MNIVLFLTLVSGTLAIAGPTWKKKEIPGQTLETPMVILLELSQSMMATDVQPTRLGRAIFKINDLFDYDPQARTALVGFAGTAHTIVPLTTDYTIIKSHVDGLSPSVMPFAGADLKAGLTLADSLMNITDAPGTALLIMDDFDDKEVEALQNYAISSENRIEIIPMGTSSGGTVPSVNGQSTQKDSEGNEIISKLNVQHLTELSNIENITINDLTLDDSDMELLAKRISANLEFTEAPEEKENDWRDAGLLLVIPMAFFILLCFRRGWSLYVVLLVISTSCSNSKSFGDLWYTKDYQAQKLANKGDYSDAATTFQDPLRKGIAYYKAGDYNAAIRSFGNDTTAMGAYNLGIAYYKSGDLQAAKLAFDKATSLDPELDEADKFSQEIENILPGGGQELDPEDAAEAEDEQGATQNTQNDSPEDLSGGGQEATKEDMKKERQEETAATDMRKGKELEEVPDDFESGSSRPDNSKILMQKVDDDPSLFLQRKFRYQVKKNNIKPKTDANDG